MRLARFVPFLVFLLISALGLTACSEEGGPADLRWEINFKCTGDAARTDHVRVRVLRDGCGGMDPAYDTMLTSGQMGPEQVLSPGDYTLEVTALTSAEVPIAFTCQEQVLPAERLEIWLTTDACDREIAAMDAGLPFVRDAGSDDDDSTDEIPLVDASVCPAGGCVDGCKIDPGPCSCSEFNGHTYLTCPAAKSWAEARKACKGLGTDLAVIETGQENAHIAAKGGGMTSWIGANDRGEDGTGTGLLTGCDATCRKPIGAAEGTWKWVDTAGGKETGPAFCALSLETNQCPANSGTYANWGAGEPNNTHTEKCIYPADPCAEGEDCGAITNGGTWQDLECKASLPYICETR
jgi:hypothetical protein